MVSVDSPLLKADPGMIALGEASPEALQAAAGNPEGPACNASLAVFRSALFFRNLFAALVAVFSAVTLGALIFVVVRIVGDDGWNATNTLAAIGLVVGGGGAAYLGNQLTKAIKVLREALADVDKYCGGEV